MRPGDAGQLLNPRHLLTRRLIVLEDAFVDEEPRVGGYAFIVPGHAAQRAVLCTIGLDVHDRGTESQLPDRFLWRRHEARASVVGLFADRAIELGGVADRF